MDAIYFSASKTNRRVQIGLIKNTVLNICSFKFHLFLLRLTASGSCSSKAKDTGISDAEGSGYPELPYLSMPP